MNKESIKYHISILFEIALFLSYRKKFNKAFQIYAEINWVEWELKNDEITSNKP
jgi:hypothetical protein